MSFHDGAAQPRSHLSSGRTASASRQRKRLLRSSYDPQMALPTSQNLRDLLWALLLTVMTQVELVVAQEQLDRPVAQHVTFALITAPVALHRRAPLSATATGAVGMSLQTLAGPAPVVGGFIAMLVLLASLGFHAGYGRGLIGVVVMGAAVTTADLIVETFVWADLLGNLVIVLMAWGFARVARTSIDARVVAEVSRDRAARQAVSAERARIARDLHDSVAHTLTWMTLQAGAARERTEPEVARDALAAIETGGREALGDMHRFLRLLDDERAPAATPGLQDLHELVQKFHSGGFQVDLATTGDPGRVPSSVSSTAYRIVQEGLTNAVKHSGASGAQILVTHQDGRVEVSVSDTGQASGGQPAMALGSGRGLAALRERLKIFDGTMSTDSAGSGWRLSASIPSRSDR